VTVQEKLEKRSREARRSESLLPEADRRKVKPGRRVVDERREAEDDEAYEEERRVKMFRGDPSKVLLEDDGEEVKQPDPSNLSKVRLGKTAKKKAAEEAKLSAELARQEWQAKIDRLKKQKQQGL